MVKRSLKGNLRYNFDNIMSKGTLSLIGFLAVIFFILIVVFTIVLWLTGLAPGQGIIDLFWINIFKTLNTGTMSEAAPGQLNFIISFLIALASIFVTSTLIGLLTAGIQNKIESLRKGRSIVKETNHTIILGWSEIVFTVINSLMEANKNQRKCAIVVMGDKDKVEMEDAIREKVKPARNIRIICRKGSPINVNDLKIVNLAECKSIIIIEDSDSRVLKTILAINNRKDVSRRTPYNIVAVLNDNKNINSGKIAGKGQASFILNNSFIARLIAHTCHQPGLSLVYSELLSFEGNEIYSKSFKELDGKSFREAVFMFEDSSVIGINQADKVILNPPADTVIKEGDRVLVISGDDDSIILSGRDNYYINSDVIYSSEKSMPEMDKILILGWNEKAKIIIQELVNYIAPKTEITVVTAADPIEEFKGSPENIVLEEKDSVVCKDVNISFIRGDINNYDLLIRLAGEGFEHIVVLAYPDMDIQEADSMTLMTLIHLREIAEKNGLDFSITSEMLDINNRDLAKIARVDDFIISEKLTSLLLAQISENRLLDPLYEELLCEEGSEIYLKRASDYLNIKEPVNFYTVLEAGMKKNDLAIGYKLAREENLEDRNFGIYINPEKSVFIELEEEDCLIVLSEKL